MISLVLRFSCYSTHYYLVDLCHIINMVTQAAYYCGPMTSESQLMTTNIVCVCVL